MKSVCIVTETRGFGGVENHTISLMGALIERGYQIELIANRNHEYDRRIATRDWADKVSIVHTDFHGICDEGNDAINWRNTFAKVRSQTVIFPKGDFAHGKMSFLRECRRRFKKVIFIEHLEPGPGPEKVSRKWMGILPGLGLRWHMERMVLKARSIWIADRIVAVSNKVKEGLVRRGYSPSRITVVQNGVNWRDFSRSEETNRMIRAKYGIAPDAFVFGMLARLEREKGVDIALRSLHLLTQNGVQKPVTLLIAGKGALSEELKQLATDLNVQEHVRFAGFVDAPQELLSAYDVILFSSRLEGLPLGLLEGMATGCLPIVTRVSGMPEAVSSPEIGWVVAPENAEELSAAMSSAIKLADGARTQMKQNASRQVEQNFDLAETHRKIIELCGL